MQVLSMFGGFGFAWPPAVKAIFNAFSLVNFNFDLLAPECSVSLDFESKWCAPRHELDACAGGCLFVCMCMCMCDGHLAVQNAMLAAFGDACPLHAWLLCVCE
jgi:hypothetical protein